VQAHLRFGGIFKKKDGDFGVPVRNPGESHPTIGETASFLDRLRDTRFLARTEHYSSKTLLIWPTLR